MNRAVSGMVVVLETGQPLRGLIVTVHRLCPDGPDLLGWGVTGEGGGFRMDYPRLETPPDLVISLHRPDGQLLYLEPPHRSVAGAELQVRVELPLACLSPTVH